MLTDWETKLKNAAVAVLGLGVSNRPLIDFLLSRGARVVARDRKTREALGEFADELEARGVRLITGESYLDDLCEEIIFRTPGIRPDLPPLVDAVAHGAILTSEMELFLELTPAMTVAVTGSDGKTTTTTLVGEMLKAEFAGTAARRVFVGGNIGTPLLPMVDEMNAEDVAVLELSSFQLMSMTLSPMISAITNVTKNHMDWHRESMEEYVTAKANIFRHSPNRCVVLNADCPDTRDLAKGYGGQVRYFSAKKRRSDFEGLLREGDLAFYVRDGQIVCLDGEEEREMLAISDILLPGGHNVENYMTAIALTHGMVSLASIAHVARSFAGVEHRLERIRVYRGVTYYNSSIDSTPSRTAAALSALAPKRPIVICGGYDKKIPFEPLATALCEHAKAVVLTGATAEKIRACLARTERVQNGGLPVLYEQDFDAAVRRAAGFAEEGDTVLLSPACASFDAFENFMERGNTFRRLVQALE